VSLGRSVRRAGSPPDAAAFNARWNAVGASYFDAMGLPVKRGRAFTDVEAQRPGAPRVAVIDEVLARQVWPDGDAVGSALEFAADDAGAPASGPIEVVGIVPVVRDDFFDKTPGGAVYVPMAQGYRGNVHFHVRPATGAAGPGLSAAVRGEIRSAAPGLPLFRVTTFGAHLDESLEHWGVQLMAGLFSFMGGMATVVALFGIYGAKSYAVARRTREIGVRMALGATPGRVVGMIVGEGLRLALWGVGLGLLIGLGLGRVLDSVFVEVVAFDPLTFTAAPAFLLLACVAAAWLPARRATTVNPMTALRAD
jgi:hypothetical protein